MTALIAARDRVETANAVIRVRAREGLVRIQATVAGTGDMGTRTLLFPAITPPDALLLAHRITAAAAEAVQPALELTHAHHGRGRLSAADVAEMRRLRAAGMKLREIAKRFHCAASAVAYQTAGLIDPALNHWKRRDHATLDAIVRMHGAGRSAAEIAADLHCSASGVRAVIRKHLAGIVRPQPNPGPVHQLPLTLRPQLVPET